MAKKNEHNTKEHPRPRARGEHASRRVLTSREERRTEEHVIVDYEPATDSFQLFLNQASRYPLLTGPEEIELAKRIEKGDLAAKERLVNSNLRLVVSIARRYQGFGLSLPDLVQEAMLGLIRAAEKFDWRRGYKFSTYATLWIRQSIQRGLDNTGREIRIPAHVAQQLRNLNRAEADLTAKLDRSPTDEELAANSKFSTDEVAAMRDLARVTTSLDATVGDDSDTTLGELYSGEAPAPEEDVIERGRERAVHTALEMLPERERQVLELRYGTAGEGEKTLRDISRKLGITEERVRQLEGQGLKRLARAGSLDAWRDAA